MGDTVPRVRKASAIRRLDAQRPNLVGERVRLARQLHRPKLTLVEAARRASEGSGYHITRDTLIRIENLQRCAYDYEVVALAQALLVDVRFLLGLQDDPGFVALGPAD